MARGWESKSVEEQIDAAESRRPHRPAASPDPAQVTRQRELESLQLSRVRVMNDLASATHARYRESLEAALRHLDEQITLRQPPKP